MMKSKWMIVLLILFSGIFLISCQDNISSLTTTDSILQQTEDDPIYQVYLLGVDEGLIDSTYVEWLDTIKGPKGDPGKEVVLRLVDLSIQWQYSGDEIWNDLFDLSLLRGQDGVGISNTSIDLSGNLIITYTNEESVNVGKIVTVFSVEFKDDNGYLYSSQVVPYGEDALPPTVPNKIGYSFIGWSSSSEDIKENMVITALFEPIQYTVSFHSNGGTQYDSLSEINYGSFIVLPEPTKENYLFVGWFLSDSVNSSQFTSSNTVTDNLELYARWVMASYVVFFENEDGSLILSENVLFGMPAVLPANPTKTGYTFVRWDKDINNITSDLIVKPIFEVNTYSLAFSTNGGISVPSISQPYQSELPVLPVTSKLGYEFVGWYSNSSLTTPFSLTQMPLNGVTVYAKWKINSYTITFDTLGGTDIEAITQDYSTVVLTPSVPFREFYDFVGWSLNSETYVPYSFTTMPAEDITVYGFWNVATLQFSILSDGTYAISGVNPIATNVVIPSTYKNVAVTSILSGAFANGSLVESLVVPNSVISMETGCLRGLSILKDLSVPFTGLNRDSTGSNSNLGILFGTEEYTGSILTTQYVVSVQYTYQMPSTLTKVSITDSPTIRTGSLAGLSMLREVVISNSTTTIETMSFAGTFGLLKMSLPFIGSTASSTGKEACFGYIFGTYSYGLSTTYTRQATYSFFLSYNLESLSITGGTKIADYALMNMKKLREVSLPSTLVSIGVQSFFNNLELSNIVLPDNLEIISDYAFASDNYDTALDHIVLPAKTLSLGSRIFGDQEILTVYVMREYSSSYASYYEDLDLRYDVVFGGTYRGVIDGMDYVYIYGKGAVILGPHFRNESSSYVIPMYINPDDQKSGVTYIAPGSFSHNPYIEELWIGYLLYAGSNSVGGENLTVYMELPYVPTTWVAVNWNPTGVPVVLNVTHP